MKTTKVVAAIIIHDDKIFATQRGYGEFKDGWEFPGGKNEPGEPSEEAVVREIKEELDTDIEVEEYLDTVEYDYPSFHLSMDCFICRIRSGKPVLKEAEAAKWLTNDELYSVDWLPADIILIPKIKKYLIFERLSRSTFRSRFSLSEKDKEYVKEKGMDTIRSHAEDFISKRLAPAEPRNDGKQTPMHGHPVFIAQHATATCCRGCLEKWHKIPKGRELTQDQQEYIVDIIMTWIERQMSYT